MLCDVCGRGGGGCGSSLPFVLYPVVKGKRRQVSLDHQGMPVHPLAGKWSNFNNGMLQKRSWPGLPGSAALWGLLPERAVLPDTIRSMYPLSCWFQVWLNRSTQRQPTWAARNCCFFKCAAEEQCFCAPALLGLNLTWAGAFRGTQPESSRSIASATKMSVPGGANKVSFWAPLGDILVV